MSKQGLLGGKEETVLWLELFCMWLIQVLESWQMRASKEEALEEQGQVQKQGCETQAYVSGNSPVTHALV